ncbi:hypothetical protein KUTeg_021991 [Tegillarca granosa]|uniref:Temptin n=1 Tax=Tegillarca granosa TaxID=220873 RepID=A0ABQ9E5B2_TEGGR|nr:hypothetical protein KUTeg_021991 [Tegillarca granosa]
MNVLERQIIQQLNPYIKTYFSAVLLYFVPFYLSLVQSFQPYQTSIPNGYNVPHPCKLNYMWRGVGHQVPKGGGERNQFGIDFSNAGKSWTVDFCQKDSDGDGKTNGEELGDPQCKWKVGELPERTTNITHPGICEPLDSEQCMNETQFVSCDSKQFLCDALHEPAIRGMKNTTIKFPEIKILNEETQYYCMYFNFPMDGDYHMVANQPFIDNKNVLHHILLFGCDQPVTEEPNKPWRCGMGSYKCFSLLGIWAVGMAGECMHNLTGFRIGYRGYTTGMIQVHYNNPDKRDDFTDSSGLTIHYTPNRRQYDSRVLMLGQMYLEIPNGKNEYQVIGECTPECRRQMKVEHIRNGTFLEDIAVDEVYSYDSPVQHQYVLKPYIP